MEGYLIIAKRNGSFRTVATIPTLDHIFYEHLLAKTPEIDRYDLFYTLYLTRGGVRKSFGGQHHIVFDIDRVEDSQRISDYLEVFHEVTKIPTSVPTVVWSGYGIHIYIPLAEQITSSDYFAQHRSQYRKLIEQLDAGNKARKLVGAYDSSVFKAHQLMRLPFTQNRKRITVEAPEGVESYVYKLGVDIGQGYKWDWTRLVGNVASPKDFLPHTLASKFQKLDVSAIEGGCSFLQHCKSRQGEVTEPMWYAMLSLVSRFDSDFKYAHEYSREHPKYSPQETQEKAQQSLESSGPRLCESIARDFWKGCFECPHFTAGEIVTPIQLVGVDIIGTEQTGFCYVVKSKNGQTKHKINYNDLMKAYYRDNPFLCLPDMDEIYTYNGTKWEITAEPYVRNYAEEKIRPHPMNSQVSEFVAKIKRNNLYPAEIFEYHGLINLRNGTYEVKTGVFREHRMDDHLNMMLDFDFDPDAKCPMFEKFLDEIMEGDREKIRLLMEYLGVTLAGIPSHTIQKCLILQGRGANGKSVFVSVVRNLLGKELVASMSLNRDSYKDFSLHLLYGKLANISEEMDEFDGKVFNGDFKNIVSGGEVKAAKKGKDAYFFRVNAKYFICCNSLPKNKFMSDALDRRLLIVSFNRVFGYMEQDINLEDKLKTELSGIFNLVLGHLKDFLKRGRFLIPSEVIKSNQEHKEESDVVLMFVRDCVEILDEEGEFVSVLNDIYPAFQMYCERMGERYILGYREFVSIFCNHIGRTTAVYRVGKKTLRGLKHIKLITDNQNF